MSAGAQLSFEKGPLGRETGGEDSTTNDEEGAAVRDHHNPLSDDHCHLEISRYLSEIFRVDEERSKSVNGATNTSTVRPPIISRDVLTEITCNAVPDLTQELASSVPQNGCEFAAQYQPDTFNNTEKFLEALETGNLDPLCRSTPLLDIQTQKNDTTNESNSSILNSTLMNNSTDFQPFSSEPLDGTEVPFSNFQDDQKIFNLSSLSKSLEPTLPPKQSPFNLETPFFGHEESEMYPQANQSSISCPINLAPFDSLHYRRAAVNPYQRFTTGPTAAASSALPAAPPNHQPSALSDIVSLNYQNSQVKHSLSGANGAAAARSEGPSQYRSATPPNAFALRPKSHVATAWPGLGGAVSYGPSAQKPKINIQNVWQSFNRLVKQTHGGPRDNIPQLASDYSHVVNENRTRNAPPSNVNRMSMMPNYVSYTHTANITKRFSNSKVMEESRYCGFCKNNGECEDVYMSHKLKDQEGNVSCPVLRDYKCPICGVSGDKAHTLKYCPKNAAHNKLQGGRVVFETPRNSTGRKKSESMHK